MNLFTLESNSILRLSYIIQDVIQFIHRIQFECEHNLVVKIKELINTKVAQTSANRCNNTSADRNMLI